MHKATIAPNFCLLGLTLLVGISSVGCKSMPKIPWSKTAATSDPSSEALAHSAPTKPSDLAKQAEGLAAAQIAGGEAAPFVPSISGITSAAVASTPTPTSAYPTTTAPSFSQVPAASVAAVTPTPSAILGSVKLPYDPNAVPPATLSPAEAALASANAAAQNRYANVTTPQAGHSHSHAAVEVAEPANAASRYGAYAASAQNSQPAQPSSWPAVSEIEALPNQVAVAAESLAADTPVGRYAQSVAAATGTLPAAAPSYAPPTTTASIPATITPTPATVASTAPYRPGGTTSYPTTAVPTSGIEIASRPNSPGSTGTQVPSLATPTSGEPTAYPVTPQTPRYR